CGRAHGRSPTRAPAPARSTATPASDHMRRLGCGGDRRRHLAVGQPGVGIDRRRRWGRGCGRGRWRLLLLYDRLLRGGLVAVVLVERDEQQRDHGGRRDAAGGHRIAIGVVRPRRRGGRRSRERIGGLVVIVVPLLRGGRLGSTRLWARGLAGSLGLSLARGRASLDFVFVVIIIIVVEIVVFVLLPLDDLRLECPGAV